MVYMYHAILRVGEREEEEEEEEDHVILTSYL